MPWPTAKKAAIYHIEIRNWPTCCKTHLVCIEKRKYLSTCLDHLLIVTFVSTSFCICRWKQQDTNVCKHLTLTHTFQRDTLLASLCYKGNNKCFSISSKWMNRLILITLFSSLLRSILVKLELQRRISSEHTNIVKLNKLIMYFLFITLCA